MEMRRTASRGTIAGWVLILLGLFALLASFLLRPMCLDIPEYSPQCVAVWLPFTIPMVILGGAGVILGVYLLWKLKNSA